TFATGLDAPLCIAFAGPTASPTPTATFTPTPTATFTPTPTATFTPTVTPTPSEPPATPTCTFTPTPTATPTGSPTCSPPPSDLVGWWPGDGNIDDIVGGNNGTLQGNVTFASGMVGEALSFDGNSYIDASDSNLPVGNSSATISAWIKTTQTGEKFFV